MSYVVERSISQTVLDKVMHLFWQNGYFNTSIDDIVRVTGLNRAAIYNYYGDKEALFLAMLNRYRDHVTTELTSPLQKENRGLHNIQSFLIQLNFLLNQNILSKGCFLIAVASDAPSHHKKVRQFIDCFMRDLHDLFLINLVAEKERNTFLGNQDLPAIADFLVGNVYGLMTLCRSKAPNRVFENQVILVMDYLNSLTNHPSQNRGN